MMKKSFFVGAILLGVAVMVLGGWYVFQSPTREVSQEEVPSDSLINTIKESLPLSEGGPEVDPLSLVAFADQSFDGHDFKVGNVLAENEIYTRYYITYKSGDLTISGIMNVPKGKGPFPLLMLNHGHIDTSIYTNGRGLKREQDYLARQGYVVIHSDYRGHAESDDDPNADRNFRLGYAEDVINAILAVKAANLPYIDAERVGMLGHSMGGGVAWRIAVTQPDLVDAYVQFAPVSADERDNFAKWTARRAEVAEQIIQDHGKPEDNPQFWDNISPINFFNQIETPVMIHHGTADESVPLAWSERESDQLKKQGKDVTLYVYSGEPHEFIAAWPTVMQRTTSFFDKHLK